MISKISERMLKKWRGEALKGIELNPASSIEANDQVWNTLIACRKRLLLMTQELLDMHLIEDKK